MKVLLAAGLYPPEIGGPATYALLLEKELPKRGIEVAVLPFGTVRQYPKVIRHFAYAWSLFKAQRDADIIYALDSVSVGIPAMVISKLTRKPFLIRLGGDYAWEQGRVRFGLTSTLDEFHTDKKRWPFMVKLLSYLQATVVKQAVRVVAPSVYLQSIIEKWGVRPDRIVVIYSALYPLAVEESKDELRTQLGYTTPTLVSAGRLVPWKGFSAVLEVVARLKHTYPDITLVVAGNGEELESLKAQAASLSIKEQVRFVGSLSKDALGATIKAADVFVLNTAYEGLSHQLIEVMDLGTPIVTTTAGGNPELITHEVNGLLVPFNDTEALSDSVTRLLDYPETRTRIIQSARARSKDFSEEHMLHNIEALLHDIHAKRIT